MHSSNSHREDETLVDADETFPLILSTDEQQQNKNKKSNDDKQTSSTAADKPRIGLPITFMILLFAVSASQNMSTSLLTLLFNKSLEPQQISYFWLFMSWIYWAAPFSGWVSDVCGNRRIMLIIALVANIISWCLITYAVPEGEDNGGSLKWFLIFGALQNASMMFVNSAINGALVEVAKAIDPEEEEEEDEKEEGSEDEGSEEKKTDESGNSLNTTAVENNNTPLLLPSSSPVMNAASSSLLSDSDNNNNNNDNTNDLNQSPPNEEDMNNNNNNKQKTTKPEKNIVATTMHSRSGDTQSTAMLARSLGSVIGGVVQTFALMKMSIRDAFVVSIVMYGVTAVLVVFATFAPSTTPEDEEKRKKLLEKKKRKNGVDTDSFCSRITSLFKRLRQLCDARRGDSQRSAARDVFILLVFIFCNNMLPDASGFYQSYIFDAFSYPNWVNSTYQLFNLVGALAACEVYRRFLASKSQTKVFLAGCLFAATSYCTGIAFCTGFTRDTLHISNTVYLMIDTFIVGFLNRLSFMPILHVASVRCPKGFEAVVFELFSVAAIGGSTVSSLVAIQIANRLNISKSDWSNLWILMTIAATSRLLPMIVVPSLPPPEEEKKKNTNNKKKQKGESDTDCSGEEDSLNVAS